MSFGGNGGDSGSIQGSTDVFLSSLNDGQVLAYDTSTLKWINSTVVGTQGPVGPPGIQGPKGDTVTGGACVLSVPGVLSVGAGSARYPIGLPCTLAGVTAALGTAANQDVIIDINRNGTSIFADANDRPKILAGQHLTNRTLLNTAMQAGDYITIDRDQVGGLAPATIVAATDNTSGGQTVVIPRPSGAANGDIHIAAIQAGVGGTPGVNQPTTAVTAPAGWAALGAPTRQVDNPNGRDIELHLYWWRDDGSQASWSFSVTQPTVNSYATGRVITVRGCVVSGSPIDTYTTTTSAAGSSSPAAPSVTTTVAGDTLLAIFLNTNAPTNPGVPSGMTFIGTTSGFVTAYQADMPAGATGIRTLTDAGTSPSSHWINASVALLTDADNGAPGADLTVVLDYTT